MAKRRSSTGKREREIQKRQRQLRKAEKAAQKRERRFNRDQEGSLSQPEEADSVPGAEDGDCLRAE